jgi:hypothetical protein
MESAFPFENATTQILVIPPSELRGGYCQVLHGKAGSGLRRRGNSPERSPRHGICFATV